jgi:hypothetical protein
MFVAPVAATVPNVTEETEPVGPMGPDDKTALPVDVVGA